MTTYNIFLVNNSSETQLFWLFLACPPELANNPGVFANSQVFFQIEPNSTSLCPIPTDFIIGAGSGSQNVEAWAQAIPDITTQAAVQDTVAIQYATVPPNMPPNLSIDSGSAPSNTIAVSTNAFNKVANEANHWFSSQFYGIETKSGFIGMAWSPEPSQNVQLTPVLKFWVTTNSSFVYGQLVPWQGIGQNGINVYIPQDFADNSCTVTLGFEQWQVKSGPPNAS